jgi:hypothetical protein
MHVLRTRGNLTTERAGVNFVRQVVEGAGCLFKEINLQHDFGHDATFVLVVDGVVQPREVAVQIKSGKSYNRASYCRIPVTPAHLSFWAKHDLPTLGVVYDPSERTAYWMDLKTEAKAWDRASQKPTSVKFRKSLWNRFNSASFTSTLIPILMGKSPAINLEEAVSWSGDSDYSTHEIGVRVLLTRYYVAKRSWETLIALFWNRDANDMSYLIPSAFSKLLGNWDLSYTFSTEQLSPEVEDFARTFVTNLGQSGIAKLLEFLDYDEGWDFGRGTLGRALLTIFEAQKDMRASLGAIAKGPATRKRIGQMARDLDLAYSEDPHWYWG